MTKSEHKKGQTTLFTFTVTLSAAYDQAVTMSFRTANGTAKTSDSDYIAKTGTLTFAPDETSEVFKTSEVRKSHRTLRYPGGSGRDATKRRGIPRHAVSRQ